MGATIKDIAKVANVSRAAVSVALRGSLEEAGIRVSEETRERILKVARDLGHSPNMIARGLRKGRTNSIGLVIENLGVEVSTAKARTIEDIAYANGYRVFTCSNSGNPEREEADIRDLVGRRVDGFILAGPSLMGEGPFLQQLIKDHFPVVMLYAPVPLSASSVVVDNFHGGYIAVKHLVEIGRTKMVFICGSRAHASIQRRIEGWRHACDEAGLDFDAMPLMEYGTGPAPSAQEAGYQMCQALLNSGSSEFDGLVATNDLLALGATKALQDRGLRTPANVAVIGFDDNAFSAYLSVPLTTISQPTKEISEAAFKLLLERIEDHSLPIQQISIKPSLVMRQSTMIPRISEKR